MRLFGILVLSLASASAAAECQMMGPFEIDSKKVYQGSSSKGQTAKNAQCFDARSDGYILGSSIEAKLGSNGGNGSKRCDKHGLVEKVETIKHNGHDIDIDTVRRFCIEAHAETGGGFMNKYTTAWATCHVTYKDCEIN